MTAYTNIFHVNGRERTQQSGYLVGVKVLKNNEKDILRTIRFSFEWLKTFFSSLGDFGPIKNIIELVKGGEEALSFSELGISSLKMMHGVAEAFNSGITNSISLVTRGALDLTWNFFKLCKTLQKYKILVFASRFIVSLTAIGGISFAISSADRIYGVSKELFILQNSSTLINNNAHILFNLYQLAKNIGTCAVGAIVAANVLLGFAPPGSLMLVLGTCILVSNISASVIKECCNLQVR